MRHNSRPAVATLQQAVEAGHLLHGSSFDGISTLIPHKSKLIRMDDLTGETIQEPPQVCATESIDVAIFFATVRSVCNRANVWRAAGIRGNHAPDGSLIDYTYFASVRAGELAQQRESAGKRGIVYIVDRNYLTFERPEAIWTSCNPVPLLGWVSVSCADLSFDLGDLTPPDRDPDIHNFYEHSRTPPETPPRLVTLTASA